ncbi:MAG TPA: hypothetical protein VM165_22525 [Planctomycetaceae bacterium]|nr:hypothetical protein [Planctomycetaceae bacterium]
MPPTTSERSRNQSLAVGVWTGLALIAAMLWSRRFAGEFIGPVPVGLIVLWTAFVSAASAAAWWLYRTELSASDNRLKPRLTAVAAALAFFTSWAGAPGLTPLQTGVFIGLWCLAGLLAWSVREGESLWATVPPETSSSSPVMEPAPQLSDVETGDESAEDADAIQTMSRRSSEEGEVIEGVVRVILPPGDRDATVHLSFCPPLATTPTVELEDVDGLGWELKVAAAYPFGLRLQIRRGRLCDEEMIGRIAYWALSATASRAA